MFCMKLHIFLDPVTYSQSLNYMHTSLHGYRIDPLHLCFHLVEELLEQLVSNHLNSNCVWMVKNNDNG